MKRKVRLSSYCWIISLLSTAMFCALFIYALNQPDNKWVIMLLGIVIVGLLFSTLFYMPLSISVDENDLIIIRPLRSKRISLEDIAEVMLCSPTIAEHGICGSRGWYGYYGWFREPTLGKYFAYYGKASDCFLVTLKNDRKYMLSCTEAPSIVAEVNSRLN